MSTNIETNTNTNIEKYVLVSSRKYLVLLLQKKESQFRNIHNLGGPEDSFNTF